MFIEFFKKLAIIHKFYKIRSGRSGERPAIEELARRRFFHRFILFVVLTLLGELVLG